MVEKKKNNWRFSYKPLLICLAVGFVVALLSIILGITIYARQETREKTEALMLNIESRLEYRVETTIRILESLAGQEQYDDPSIPMSKRVDFLEKINENLGYMMIRYVDENMNVHSHKGATSLAAREYMQKLFASGQVQITDSFLAGADGKTLNYTVAVPVIRDGKVTGALFAAIYFDEVTEMIQEAAHTLYADALLLGSKLQIMSSTRELDYEDSYISIMKNSNLFGREVGEIEEDLYNKKNGNFLSFKGGDLRYNTYTNIENTNWSIVCSTSFSRLYRQHYAELLIRSFVSVLLFVALYFLIRLQTDKQIAIVEEILHSFSELEYRIYNEERSEDVEFKDILQMTRAGLCDGLTGVVTRTVFLSQLLNLMKERTEGEYLILCFIDLDDLKIINDTYGHGMGDTVLKDLGYVLREYEKQYDGLLGRYGGDEFALCLRGIKDEEELRDLLDELVMRLQITVSHNEEELSVHCSVGVSIWDGYVGCDMLINQADEALYFVKRNGKNYYKIYQS